MNAIRAKLPIIAYGLFIMSLLCYSFALTDPNITFLNNSVWSSFRETMVHFGFYQRRESWMVFFGLVLALFAVHFYFTKNAKRVNALHIAVPVGLLLLLSYPFLSHDLFNYMFDARILTHYGSNPYLHRAMDYPNDPWLRFMHWTHRTYPYGPTFLPLTLIPSFLSFGKFALDFVLFKGLFVIAYISTVFMLQKKDKAWAVFFATHPLVLLEGLVNAHNDLIAVWLGIIGVLMLKNRWRSGLFFGASAGIKYITAPLFALLFPLKGNVDKYLALAGVAAPILWISFTGEPQPWYYLNFLIFIPFFFDELQDMWVLSFGLLISYYPFIALGDWGMAGNTEIKHQIMLVFAILQIGYFLWRKKFKSKWSFVRKGA